MDSQTNTTERFDLNPRQREILHQLEDNGYQAISELAPKLNVSEQTIRRDLKKLEDFGLLSKYHGGASLIGRHESSLKAISQDTTSSIEGLKNKELALREVAFVEEKQAIAKAVSDLIVDGSSLFITIGTTVEYIARELLNKKDLLIVTNSIRVANILYPASNIKVLVPSGSIKTFNGGIEGPNALRDLSQFRADFCVSSIGAIDPDGTLLDFNYSEVVMAQMMLKNSKQSIIASDHSKFQAQAPVKLAHLSEISYLVTDTTPQIDTSNVKLILP